MRSYKRTTTGLVLDRDGIALAQNLVAATAMLLNGVTAGILSPPRRIQIFSAADHTSATFVVIGKDRAGCTITESIVGPGAGLTVTGTKVFSSITSITPSASIASDSEVGFGAEAISGWLFLGQVDHGAAYQTEVSGTVNYDIEYTFKNIMREGINGDYDSSAAVFQSQSGKTALVTGLIEGGVGALRIKQNSGTGSVTLRVIPAAGK